MDGEKMCGVMERTWKEKVRFEKKGEDREGKRNMKGHLEGRREKYRRQESEREVCRKRSVGKINMLSSTTGKDNQSCLTLVSPWC